MRVLHLSKTAVGGRWIAFMARELVRAGVEVHVAVTGDGPTKNQFQEWGAQVHPQDYSVRRCLKCATSLRRLIDEVRPDLIHSHFVHTTLIARLALGRKGPPRIFQIPGPLHLEHLLYRRLDLQTRSAPDYYIGTCLWTRDALVRYGVPAHRVHHSICGMGLDRFPEDVEGDLRQDLGIGADEKVIIMVAYFYPPKKHLGQKVGLKGHETILEAMPLILKRCPDARLVLVGSPWNNAVAYEAALKRQAQPLGDRVIFAGRRNDVASAYADADVAVCPSLSENLGAASESMAMAVPTIATNIGGFPDLILHGATGWLVPPCSPEHLAAAVCAVLDDLPQAREVGRRGQEHARHLMDVRRTAAEVKAIYEAIL